MDDDTSWCPVCDRAIQPIRRQVPVTPQPRGLVQGTGRAKSLPPVRFRTVIEQGPTPLYCSKECSLVDQTRLSRDTRSDAASTSTTSSESSASESSDSVPTTISKSLATLAAIYHFPPLPPPAPIYEEEPVQRAPVGEYTNGIIMSARRIAKELAPLPPQRDSLGRIIPPTGPRGPIPGWTDGSHAWRASVYNLTTPDSSTPAVHKSFATRNTRGVSSSVSHSRQPNPTVVASESDADLLRKFSESFRRTSRVATPAAGSPTSLPPTPTSPSSFPPSRKERPLLERGAEGKLLVPKVMMRVNSFASSSTCVSSTGSRPSVRSPLSQDSSSDEEDGTRRCGSTDSLKRHLRRPTVETRSWSYDNVKTYPIMRLPKKRIEKRIETRVVDGKELEVEVEVEVEYEEPLKRLFQFASSTPVRH